MRTSTSLATAAAAVVVVVVVKKTVLFLEIVHHLSKFRVTDPHITTYTHHIEYRSGSVTFTNE